MVRDIFKFSRANAEKLKKYGFTETGNCYSYETTILNGQFSMLVTVNGGEVSTKVTDITSEDEYRLHLVEDSAGEFVGAVRAEFERVLTDIRDKCFDREIFKSVQAKEVIEYIRASYADELEFLWEKLPTAAIWRRKDNNKWYGILLVIPRAKLGLEGEGLAEIIDLRIEPSESAKIIDNKQYFAGYHMNKTHWLTICLDCGVPTKTIFERIDKSYALALKK